MKDVAFSTLFGIQWTMPSNVNRLRTEIAQIHRGRQHMGKEKERKK